MAVPSPPTTAARALRRWRRERASADGVPAYVVAHDTTSRDRRRAPRSCRTPPSVYGPTSWSGTAGDPRRHRRAVRRRVGAIPLRRTRLTQSALLSSGADRLAGHQSRGRMSEFYFSRPSLSHVHPPPLGRAITTARFHGGGRNAASPNQRALSAWRPDEGQHHRHLNQRPDDRGKGDCRRKGRDRNGDGDLEVAPVELKATATPSR